MTKTLDGVRFDADFADVRGAGRFNTLSPEAAQSLALRGQVAYRVIVDPPASPMRPTPKPATGGEARGQVRRRTRLRSAKLVDGANAFLCEALVQDASSDGMRLLLSRNVGLPARIGVYDDESEEIVTAILAWRRGQAVGVRILHRGPPAQMKPAQRFALRGRYYGIRD